ncbi:MAG: 6,7-dimethyl-8-ribityllumazine synthase [Armatimonadetes bacterium]|jgi:6,7-dimethyl-8-ribityllumazine synthase|nr:6,7-dimethyl-8-ribityllumazine synthase [Armatimonadota bacterium]MDI9586129.1 6,7-dimethyl-8-ribityllumazine synthase [Acidobacteriota bacterium]
MPRVIEGKLDATGLKFGIVVSRFNEFITGKLLAGALDAIVRHGGSDEDVDVVWMPGSFELPLAAKKMAESGKYDAVICVGAVIRGGTSHFDFVAGEAAKGIAQAAMQTGIPVIFGVITTETIEQAIERAGTRLPNRGFEAAVTAIEAVNALKQID